MTAETHAADLPADPFALFARWMAEAEAGEPHDANAVALATASAGGRPSARMVLLKDVSGGGFVFYSNAESRKGGDLAANPQAALLFHWKSLRRQIRIEGRVVPVGGSEADRYFASRARGSQIGAWASRQSRPLKARAVLERRTQEYEEKFAGREVPRPEYWQGWRLIPDGFEFWVDRRDRLHERYTYRRAGGEEAAGAAEAWVQGGLYP